MLIPWFRSKCKIKAFKVTCLLLYWLECGKLKVGSNAHVLVACGQPLKCSGFPYLPRCLACNCCTTLCIHMDFYFPLSCTASGWCSGMLRPCSCSPMHCSSWWYLRSVSSRCAWSSCCHLFSRSWNWITLSLFASLSCSSSFSSRLIFSVSPFISFCIFCWYILKLDSIRRDCACVDSSMVITECRVTLSSVCWVCRLDNRSRLWLWDN